MQVQLPSSFLWGAAISSYQTEGGNFHSDWYLWEKERGLEQAGRACNHYHLFENDFQSARQLNLNSLRLSVEWSRVFPEQSTINQQELEHYKKVVAVSLAKFQIKPLVTLHHFTNPIWFADKGGWLSCANIDCFLLYLRKVVEALSNRVKYWLIFNEPLVYIYYGFIRGDWPPGRKSPREAKKALGNILEAYRIGYQEIKRIYGYANSPVTPQVSLAKHLRAFSPCPRYNFGQNTFSSFLMDRVFNFSPLDYLAGKNCLDFLGINYYSKGYARFKGVTGEECEHTFHQGRRNFMGWYIYPQGFYRMLTKLKEYGLPVIITENGTAESQESFYEDYLTSHLNSMAKAFLEGVDIGGYMWWSLLDNFEWDKGFGPRFGLIEVDYATLQRKIRPFARTYAKICKDNEINI